VPQKQVFVDTFEGQTTEASDVFRMPPEVSRHETRTGVLGGGDELSMTIGWLQDFLFHKSLQQMVLSKDFVRHACYSIEARRLLLYLANTQAPDEIFFPTLLQDTPKYQPT